MFFWRQKWSRLPDVNRLSGPVKPFYLPLYRHNLILHTVLLCKGHVYRT